VQDECAVLPKMRSVDEPIQVRLVQFAGRRRNRLVSSDMLRRVKPAMGRDMAIEKAQVCGANVTLARL
jgi:hypothetical protein